MAHLQFARRYALCSAKGKAALKPYAKKDPTPEKAQEICDVILGDAAVEAALLAGGRKRDEVLAVGKTRVFLKDALAQKALETVRDAVVAKFAVLCQAAWRSFSARNKASGGLAEKKRKARQEEARRAKNARAHAVLGAWARGALVRKSLSGAKANYGGLKAAVAASARASLADDGARKALEDALLPFTRGDLASCLFKDGPAPALAARFPRPVATDVAGACARCLKMRRAARVVRDVAAALSALDVPALRIGLQSAKTLDLMDVPEISTANAELDRVVRTAAASQSLKLFLDDPLGAAVDDVPGLLKEVEALNLLGLEHARIAYNGVKTALDARMRLKDAVERVDHENVDVALAEVMGLEKPPPWPEVRAARALGRMRIFEETLDAAPAPGAVLDDTLLELCFRVELASDCPATARAARAALEHAAGPDLGSVVRAYKWRAVFCTWLYPTVLVEVTDAPVTDAPVPPPVEFYGLDVAAARRAHDRRRRNLGETTPVWADFRGGGLRAAPSFQRRSETTPVWADFCGGG